MGLAFSLAYPHRLLLVAAVAVGLEALQLLTPDRHGRSVDAIVKIVGGVCGIGAGQMVLLLS